MAFGYFYRPAELLRVSNCFFNMLIGMPWARHQFNPTLLFTCVKRKAACEMLTYPIVYSCK